MPKLEKRLIRRADKIRSTATKWIAEGTVASQIVTCVVGKTEHGLHEVLWNLAAKVSTGSAWPSGEHGTEAGRVLIVSLARGVENEVQPSLRIQGAKLSHIRIVSGYDLRAISKSKIDVVRDWLCRNAKKAKLVVVDDLGFASVGASQSEVIDQLSNLAQEFEVSVVCGIPQEIKGAKFVRALQKAAQPHRLAIFAIQGPDEGLGLIPFTMMLTPGAEPTAFVIKREPVTMGPMATFIEWDASMQIKSNSGSKKSALEHARVLLTPFLKGKDQVASNQLHEEAGKLGFTPRTANAVASIAGFRRSRSGGTYGKGMWVRAGAKLKPEVSEAVGKDDYLMNVD